MTDGQHTTTMLRMALSAPQPVHSERGLCCPHHAQRFPRLRFDPPGDGECPERGRLFTQKRQGMTFTVEDPDGL
ncbi:MAG: hypothetical protein GY851_02180 [bacterium]|nr:hypothetical protein [bacterium]